MGSSIHEKNHVRIFTFLIIFCCAAASALTLPGYPRTLRDVHKLLDGLATTRHSERNQSMIVWTTNVASGNVTDKMHGWQSLEGSKPKVLVVAGLHGREFITTEVALSLIDIVSRTHQNVQWTIVPIVNEGGRAYAQRHECARRSPEGMDLNRGFPTRTWSPKRYSRFNSEEYSGPMPLSAPGAYLLHALTEQLEPDLVIDIHSGECAVYMPWQCCTNRPPKNKTAAIHLQQALWESTSILKREMVTAVKVKNPLQDARSGKCLFGHGARVRNHGVHGTFVDWAHEQEWNTHAVLLEVFGGPVASIVRNDCFKFFNPATAGQSTRLAMRWAQYIETVVSKLYRQ